MSIFNFIKNKINIEDIVGEYLQLKNAGHYLKGKCPFHSEKDASFTVSPQKGIFYCFGCQAGGDAIAFISKIENLTPIEATNHIIERYNIEVPKEIRRAEFVEIKKSYFSLCEAVSDWTHNQLLNNSVALEYLASRKISRTMIEYFEIGYFPGGLRSVNKFIRDLSDKHVLLKDLLEAGVLLESNTIYFSPFEERIIFPIKDQLGRYCGFGGRIFKDHDERAKYYNSRESKYFQKGQLLFGYDNAKKEMHIKEHAFLVEGYFDCVSMVEYGYKNTIATLGTACTPEHLKILSRQIKRLYITFDGDSAGKKAVLRVAELCWEASLDLFVITLPQGQDPASFLTSGGNFDQFIANAKDIFSFFIETIGDNFLEKSFSEKLEISHKIVEIIAKVRDSFKQDLLLVQAASVLQLPFESLKSLLSAQLSKAKVLHEPEPEELKHDNSLNGLSGLEKRIIFATISNIDKNEGFAFDEELIPYFSEVLHPMLRLVLQLKETASEGERFKFFLEGLSEHEKNWVISQTMNTDGDETIATLKELVSQFQKQKWRAIVADIKARILRAKKENDEKGLEELMKKFLGMKQDMKGKGLI